VWLEIAEWCVSLCDDSSVGGNSRSFVGDTYNNHQNDDGVWIVTGVCRCCYYCTNRSCVGDNSRSIITEVVLVIIAEVLSLCG
jgi:hypothetical protein